jgi:hypothetical protein
MLRILLSILFVLLLLSPLLGEEPESIAYARQLMESGFIEQAEEELTELTRTGSADEKVWAEARLLTARRKKVGPDMPPDERLTRLRSLRKDVLAFRNARPDHPACEELSIDLGELHQLEGKALADRIPQATQHDEREQFRVEADARYRNALTLFDDIRARYPDEEDHPHRINAGYLKAMTLFFLAELAPPGSRVRTERLNATIDFITEFEWESDGLFAFYVASLYKGRALEELGRIDDAIEAFDRISLLTRRASIARQYRPMILQGWMYSARAHVNEGRARADLDHLRAAAEIGKQADELFPDDPSETAQLLRIEVAMARNGLGDPAGAALLSRMADADTRVGRKALAALQQIQDTGSVATPLLFHLGQSSLEIGRYEDALSAYRELVSRSDLDETQSIAAHYRLGLTLNLLQQYAESVAPLVRATANLKHPDAEDAHVQLLKAYRSSNDPASTEAAAQTEASYRTHFPDAHHDGVLALMKARIAEEQERPADAVALYRAVPEDAGESYRKALLGIGLNLHQLALAERKAKEPDEDAIRTSLTDAIQPLTTYIQLLTEDDRSLEFGVLSARYLLARVHTELGQPEDAISSLDGLDAFVGRVAPEKLSAVLYAKLQAHLALNQFAPAETLFELIHAHLNVPPDALRAAYDLAWAHAAARADIEDEFSDQAIHHDQRSGNFFFEAFRLHRELGREMSLVNLNGVGNLLFHLAETSQGEDYYRRAAAVYTELAARIKNAPTIPVEVGERWSVTWRLARSRALSGEERAAILLYDELITEHPTKAFLLLEKSEAAERLARQFKSTNPEEAQKWFLETLNAYGEIAQNAPRASETHWKANLNYYSLMYELGYYETALDSMELLKQGFPSYDDMRFGLTFKFMVLEKRLKTALDR